MKHQGSCHCGAVKFEVDADLKEGITCNCSICNRKGTILAFVPDSAFRLISGGDSLTDYQFGKKSIHHTFCKVCGVTAFASGKMPTGEPIKAINLRCVEDLALDEIKTQFYDGKSIQI
ncbi:GFA family protein [Bdellovibrio sp. BCCA]|uniref:GFA family protein n=1 Tax=Bdellovibrio sp. BCCA TaxID=3136281 RepID=UPI0030F1ED19